GSIALTVGQNSLNSTNTFSVDGPSNAAVSPTYKKSLFIDASQLPDDSNMPDLEDITYSDDKDVVGAEADFNNWKLLSQSVLFQQQEFIKIILYQKLLEEPKRLHQALKDPSWIEAMQEELLQFKMHKVNDVARLQALVDKKKVVVTEAAIREVLRLDDADGIDCLPNEDSFIELERMSYEKPSTKLSFYKVFFSSQWKFLIHIVLQSISAKQTSWNEFSSAMASAVICLSTGDLSTHTTKYTSLALTQKDKRLRRKEMKKSMFKMLLLVMMLKEMILLLMEKFLLSLKSHPYHLLLYLLYHHKHLKISHQHPRVKHLEYDKVAQALEITKLKKRVKKLEKGNRVRVLKLHRLKRVGTSQRIDTSDDTVMDDESNQGRIIDEMDKDDAVALMDDKEEDKKDKEDKISKVFESDQVQGRQAKSQAEIYRIDMDHASKVLKEPKPLKKKQQVEMDEEYARKLHAEQNKDIDWDVAIYHVKHKAKEDPTVKRYQAMKRKPQTKAQAQKNMIMYLKNVAGFKLDYFKGMSYDDIRLIFMAKFNSNVDFLLKTKEQMEEEESRALQTINETLAEKAAKRRKLNEEVEDLKRHLEIVPDEDDDVYTEATPLARNVPIVDYDIIEINNKPYYIII
nr:putative ribonuclease H-like domain-containing protein [Tanacetum cinerariifolium]